MISVSPSQREAMLLASHRRPSAIGRLLRLLLLVLPTLQCILRLPADATAATAPTTSIYVTNCSSIISVFSEASLSFDGSLLFLADVLSPSINAYAVPVSLGPSSNITVNNVVDLSSKFSTATTQWILQPISASTSRLFYLSRSISTYAFSISSLRKNGSGVVADDPLTLFNTNTAFISYAPLSDSMLVYAAFSTPNTSIILASYNATTFLWQLQVLFVAKNVWSVSAGTAASTRMIALHQIYAASLSLFNLTTGTVQQTIAVSGPVDQVRIAGSQLVVKQADDPYRLHYYYLNASTGLYDLVTLNVTYGLDFGRRFCLNEKYLAIAMDAFCVILQYDPSSSSSNMMNEVYRYADDTCTQIFLAPVNAGTGMTRVMLSVQSPLQGAFVRVTDVT